jgi:hypothetical protein
MERTHVHSYGCVRLSFDLDNHPQWVVITGLGFAPNHPLERISLPFVCDVGELSACYRCAAPDCILINYDNLICKTGIGSRNVGKNVVIARDLGRTTPCLVTISYIVKI